MRRAVLAVALVLAESCGGSSTAPSPATTVPVPRPVVLGSGAYTLAVTLSTTGLPVCQNGICFSRSICANTPPSRTAVFNVDLERAGDTATVRVPGAPFPLVLSLLVAPTSVVGMISGSARDASGVLVDIAGTVTGAAASDAAVAVAGNIDGQISMPDGGCSNNGHTWSLTPR
jgi:hypothetical protein